MGRSRVEKTRSLGKDDCTRESKRKMTFGKTLFPMGGLCQGRRGNCKQTYEDWQNREGWRQLCMDVWSKRPWMKK